MAKPAETSLTDSTNSSHPLMVQSAEKAFAVLDVIGRSNEPLGLAEVASRTQIGKSAAQRFLHTLEKLGYIQRFQGGNAFVLSVKVLGFASQYLQSSDFIRRAQPYLAHLARETEETVNLCVLDGTEIVFISRYPSRHVVGSEVVIGTRMPAYCAAPGMAILSRLPPKEAHAVIDASTLHSYTPFTTADAGVLKHKLTKSAKDGYACAFEEYFRGDLSIASAIVDGIGRPVGAINVAVSRAHYTPEQAEARFSGIVIAVAQAASRHHPPTILGTSKPRKGST